MNSGSPEIRLERWSNDRLSLVCGLANAGGGNIVVTASEKSYQKGLIRSRKHFDTIPALVRKRLGIECSIEPVMDGVQLCLEIAVPPVTSPLEFQGSYYYYEKGVNRVMTSNEVATRIHDRLNRDDKTDQNAASARAAQSGRAPFSQTSVAAANDIALTATDEFILQALTINGRVTAAMVIEVLGVSESTVRRSLRRLREHGFIERVGSNKAGYWKVLR